MVLGLKEELGILVVNNRNDDEIEEEDDMIGSPFSTAKQRVPEKQTRGGGEIAKG